MRKILREPINESNNKRRLLFAFLITLGLFVVLLSVVIPKLRAGDTVVGDLTLHAKSVDESISLSVKDKNKEDTKVVIPLPAGVTYSSNSNPNIGVTYDAVNNQMVIDWVEGHAKKTTLQFVATKEGTYDFTARTVREEEPVTSQLCTVTIQGKEQSTSTSTQDPEQPSTEADPEPSTEESSNPNTITTAPSEQTSTEAENIEASSDKESKVQKTTSEKSSSLSDYPPGTIQQRYSGNYYVYLTPDGTLYFPSNTTGEVYPNVLGNWFDDGGDKITSIKIEGPLKLSKSNISFIFMNLSNLKSVDLTNLDFSGVTDMSSLFSGDVALETVKMSDNDFSNIDKMSSMFYDCYSLRRLELGPKLHFGRSTNLDGTIFASIGEGAWFNVGNGTEEIPEGNFTNNGKGWSSDELVSNYTGEFADTYVFKRQGGGVTVNYVDTHGKKLRDSIVLSDLPGKTYETEQKEFPGYKLRKIEGNPTGVYTTEPQTVTYIYTTDELRFDNVPQKLSFKDTKIGNHTVESPRKDPNWKIKVEDNRVQRSNWRVTATLEDQFKDSAGNPVKDNILLFRKEGLQDQWIVPGTAVDVFDGTSNDETDYYDVSWQEKEGPLIQVAPGTVKAGKYTGTINWKLVDAPA